MATITANTTMLRTALRMGSIPARMSRDTAGDDPNRPIHLETLAGNLLRVRSQWGREYAVAYADLDDDGAQTGLPPVTVTANAIRGMLAVLNVHTGPTVTLEADAHHVRLQTPSAPPMVNIAAHYPLPDAPLPVPPLDPAPVAALPNLDTTTLREIAGDTDPGSAVQFYGDRQAPETIGWSAGLWAYGRALPCHPSGQNPQHRNTAILAEQFATLDPLPSA